MRELEEIRKKSQRIAVGLMSGTSADGIDAALVSIAGSGLGTTVETLAFLTRLYSKELRDRVLAAEGASVPAVSALNYALGEAFAEAAAAVVEASGHEMNEVDFIASHGQTIHHDPNGEGGEPSTLQIGEAAVIAERTRRTVVWNFRARDIAAGGQGAPLVPLVDYILFRSSDHARVLLNLGGVANVTIVPRDAKIDDVLAFDVGPCNLLLDALAEVLLRERCDIDGRAARSGRVSRTLVEEILKHPYFAVRPPKSTGREMFGDRFTSRVLASARRLGLSDRDTLASATHMIGASVERSFAALVSPDFRHPDEIIVSGGGAHNLAVMEGLAGAFSRASVVTSREYGMDPDAKEAIAFAILGNETIEGRPANIPKATGASRAVVLGSIVPAGRNG